MRRRPSQALEACSGGTESRRPVGTWKIVMKYKEKGFPWRWSNAGAGTEVREECLTVEPSKTWLEAPLSNLICLAPRWAEVGQVSPFQSKLFHDSLVFAAWPSTTLMERFKPSYKTNINTNPKCCLGKWESAAASGFNRNDPGLRPWWFSFNNLVLNPEMNRVCAPNGASLWWLSLTLNWHYLLSWRWL